MYNTIFLFKFLIHVLCSVLHNAKSNHMSFSDRLTFLVFSQKKLTLTYQKVFFKVLDSIRIAEHIYSWTNIFGKWFLMPNRIFECLLKVILAGNVNFTIVMVYEGIFLKLVVHDVFVVQSEVET